MKSNCLIEELHAQLIKKLRKYKQTDFSERQTWLLCLIKSLNLICLIPLQWKTLLDNEIERDFEFFALVFLK